MYTSFFNLKYLKMNIIPKFYILNNCNVFKKENKA